MKFTTILSIRFFPTLDSPIHSPPCLVFPVSVRPTLSFPILEESIMSRLRRSILAAAAAGTLALGAGLFFKHFATTAHSADPVVAPAVRASNQLPISQVVLFSSGVGYFQREGEVEGAARVDL